MWCTCCVERCVVGFSLLLLLLGSAGVVVGRFVFGGPKRLKRVTVKLESGSKYICSCIYLLVSIHFNFNCPN